ncbi:DNA mismatch repair protein MutS [Roseivirga seohaensis subsp. aquiponti]|uniref:Endonuclease MutS2 n=1 Tax=Roseivirga seohaensis subsp. aquiponti TaxID=1566026 RepID=A0A0L8AI56_9BACT|nr:endonuclease MutS2 [Roseivirga seohaensis]KOF01835.1 DNA mismatch repair protein MutS [Roseivirga seohaensis subsp. aquiponti]
MLYPQNLEEKLGFDKIRAVLLEKCESNLGAQFVSKIKYATDRNSIDKWLEQTHEFTRIIQSGELFPNANYIDVSSHLKKVQMENSFLLEEEFFDLLLVFKTADQCLSFFSQKREDYPELVQLTHPLLWNDELLWSIDRKFDERGRLKDNASALLADIRKGINAEQQRLRKVLDGILRRAQKDGFTPDDVSITIREGRMVIPVLAEYKRRVRGFVHGESATGQTVYLEPSEVLEINNEVRELQYAEKREVIRILTALTDEVRPELENLSGIMKFLGIIDFIRAKARFAIDIDAIKPLWNETKGFAWQEARHPSLYLSFKKLGKKVVPLNISLDAEKRILVISGPNAGGKSVCLKTVGLLQYMFQCGLLVSVNETSRFTIYRDLFIDIGDEQSIENDLSTYSSHLVNMKNLLGHVNKGSLFLIDEFGTGTEPQFGGAIAEAILDELRSSKGMGVITTHYGNLKEYADKQQGLVNGAMKYDLKNLQPIYQLEIGKPGSSFALEIARKIGLSNQTIEYAKSKVGVKQVSVDQLLGQLESQQYEVEKAEKRVKAKEKELDELTTQYAELKSHLENQEKKILNNAKREAKVLLDSANKEVERVIREIKEAQADKERVKQARESLEAAKKKTKITSQEKEVVQTESGAIEVGSYVRIKGQETTGKVISIKGKDVELSIGALTSMVKLNRLEKITRKETREKANSLSVKGGVSLNDKMANFSRKLDIRGYRAEEVIPKLEQYMDEAILLGFNELHILHGKGNGVLRQIVRTHLSSYKEIAQMKDEHVDRGGAGITVVTMR